MKVSGVAIGQWNANCKNKEGRRRTIYKILRAIVMGKVSHVYRTKDYIVRYHDLNILVSNKGIVLSVWRDKTRKQHFVPETFKEQYDYKYTFKQNIKNAIKKHKIILNKIKNGYSPKWAKA
jgi:hypothetical protein